MKFRHLYLVFTVAAVAFSAWVTGRYVSRLVETAAFFPIRQVQVYGLKKYPVQQLVRQSGLRPGESLVFVNTTLVKQRVEAVARLKLLSVGRKFPETLVLRLAEHEGAALVAVGADTLELDRQGRVLARGSAILDWDKPLLRLPMGTAEAAATNTRVLAFIDTLAALPESERDFAGVLSEVVLGEEVELYPRAPRVRMSLGVSAELAQLRRARYALVYAQAKGLKPRRIDLRVDPVKYVL